MPRLTSWPRPTAISRACVRSGPSTCSIQTGKVKDVYKQLVANPKFELCATCGMDWVRVTGTLVPDDRVEPKKHMLDNYPALRGMYDENDDNTIVLYMQDCTATFASLSGSAPRTVEF